MSENSTSMEMLCEFSIQTVLKAVGELFIARSHRELLYFYYFIYVYVGYTSHRADTRTEVCDSSLVLWRRWSHQFFAGRDCTSTFSFDSSFCLIDQFNVNALHLMKWLTTTEESDITCLFYVWDYRIKSNTFRIIV